MAHLQYMPGDPRLVDQLVYELKSKGIFDQFRKDCISDVDTRPAYQNLRQRVESSVSLFLSRQTWKPDLNKNQLREKLRKHILDGNYLEQGVERIVDQVVNPKVASVFMPQVEDLVYNYLGIARKKSTTETSTDKGQTSTDLLPNDLEAVSPGSVKSDKDDAPEETREDAMEVDDKSKEININDISMPSDVEPEKETDTRLSGVSDLTSRDSEGSLGKLSIPMPAEEINLENIPSPENSPLKIDLDSIELPKEEPIELKDIPLPDESPKEEKDQYFKPINSEDDSSSDSSIIRNMSPLTPIRNFNNENSCDAQQAFENDTDNKSDDKKEPNSFRFTIDSKSPENSSDIKDVKPVKDEQNNLAYQFNEQVNINTFNTPLYDDSSNSHNLQIDYESDANSKTNLDKIPFPDDPTSEDSKKESTDEKKSLKSSHRSRDSHRHSSSSKDRKTDSKHSSSRDRRDPKQDKRSSKDDQSKSKSSSDKSKDRSDKKDSRDKDSKNRSSHKSSSSTSKDSKHRSSSSNQKHSSKHDDKDRKSSSSSNKEKEKVDKSSKEHKSSRDSKSSRSDKDKKSKRDDKDKDKKDKKDTDDHYSASGRGNHTRRSTDRDSNDGSSSSKGSHNQSSSKSSESKTNKGSSSKSDNTSPSSDSTSPSDKDNVVKNANTEASTQPKPVRVDTHLEIPMAAPPRLPFVPDVTLKKPRFANNLEEAKRLMKMRKFLDEEQKRMNQEAALLLEFQANVRPSLSQVYSSISGPELEFACISNAVEPAKPIIETNYAEVKPIEEIEYAPGSIEMQLSEMNQETNKVDKIEVTTNNKKEVVKTKVSTTESKEVIKNVVTTTNKEVAQTEVTTTSEAIETEEVYESIEYNQPDFEDTEKILNEISKKVYGIVDDIVEDEDMREPEVKKEEEITEGVKNEQTEFEVTVITEEIDEGPVHIEHVSPKDELRIVIKQEETPFEYFAEHEKFSAELERDKFEKFLKVYMKDIITEKLYLINCDSYEESVIREVANTNGDFEIINYHKNGHKNKNIVKNVNVSDEIVLPLDRNTPIDTVDLMTIRSTKTVLSPVKSECSFELSSDYDAKLEEMVNKTSRQEIMEIILGGTAPEESPSKLPQIDYCMEDNIERNMDLERDDFQGDDDLKRNDDLKRKLSVESLDNNNGLVLVPKMRKLSESDQISSTTEETPDRLNASRNNVRSKYLGKARRVGLSRPRRTVHPHSPSSDKSVENYDTNSPPPNGKLKRTPHVRYDTHDLYKPKLHYLSRRNHIA